MYIRIGWFRFDPFGTLARKEAIASFEGAVKSYDELGKSVQSRSEQLFQVRDIDSRTAIQDCEVYLTELANSPKEFEKAVSAFEVEISSFDHCKAELHAAVSKVDWETVGISGSATLAGVGIATLAPAGALAVATTFGTASTGVAISTLSGAAATNAALAWLGGGAVAAGGGGMAAGHALLALAGPVGWAIGGAAILGAAIMAGAKNGQIIRQAADQRMAIEEEKRLLALVVKKVEDLIDQTNQHAKGIVEMLAHLRAKAPGDYANFGAEDKERLSALVNHVLGLSALMNQRVAMD